MSANSISIAWNAPVDHKGKIVLLYLADNSGDDGVSYTFDVNSISERCGMSQTLADATIKGLLKQGYLSSITKHGKPAVRIAPPAEWPPRKP